MKLKIEKQSGYTLLEIMVVVALTGILATLAVSSMQRMSLRQQRNAASSDIVALLQQARFLARGTSIPATLTVNTVFTPPGGSITAAIGAPVNWTQSVTLGAGSNYVAEGIVGGEIGPFTITPRGAVTPSAFTLTLRDKDFSISGEEVTINVGLLGDVTTTP